MDAQNFNDINLLRRIFSLDTNVCDCRDSTVMEIVLDKLYTYIFLCEYCYKQPSIYEPKYFVEISFIRGAFRFNWYEDEITKFTSLFEKSLYLESVDEELELLEDILKTAENLNEIRIRDKSRDVMINKYSLK